MTGNGALGIGLIGAGPVAQAIHVPHLAALSDRLHVAHVMDVDAETAETVASWLGPETRHGTSMEALLADDAVDVVAICSPHAFHVEQAESAIRAGVRAVLVEKPLATTTEDAERLAAVAREHGVPVIVGAMHTYDPAYLEASRHWGDLPDTARHIRSVIQLPANARFAGLATQLLSAPGGPPPRDLSDPTQRSAAIHGTLLGLAIHDIPLLRRFLPQIEGVDSAGALSPFGYRVIAHGPDGRTAELIGHIGTSWRPEWTFEVWGTDTSLRVEFPPSYVRAGSALASIGTRTFGPYVHNGYDGEWLHLADLATGAAAPRYPFDELVADLVYANDLASRAAKMGAAA
ncbi:putative dehydrogenase [Kibdelosporangium banguiense]|uniref:Dehydrogenase n=1 Tax=Kibdelosporangium banguiense TaxID=1365924 RepID=A0ABS4TV71_9PSEU|nr:Gfo/Idh/MocA family oxidoreductase [Kibdelosporangium banguiense]MBP2328273.1 putative dehydrogenase [Kibdelosporangium banguiense]